MHHHKNDDVMPIYQIAYQKLAHGYNAGNAARALDRFIQRGLISVDASKVMKAEPESEWVFVFDKPVAIPPEIEKGGRKKTPKFVRKWSNSKNFGNIPKQNFLCSSATAKPIFTPPPLEFIPDDAIIGYWLWLVSQNS